MSDPNGNVSRIVRTLLTHRDRSRNELAAFMGVHVSAINKALTGKRSWDVDDLVKLADFFQVSPCLFFEDVDALIPADGGLRTNLRATAGYDDTLLDELLVAAA